jgi:predicted nucleic acid-binding protein
LIVIDASAIVDLLVGRVSVGSWLADRVERALTLQVPAVFDLEVLQSLRGLESAGALSSAALITALAEFVDLRATRHDHRPLWSRIWTLRHNLTAYDAAYVALAEALEAPLVTSDARLARSSGHAATIELAPG